MMFRKKNKEKYNEDHRGFSNYHEGQSKGKMKIDNEWAKKNIRVRCKYVSILESLTYCVQHNILYVFYSGFVWVYKI